MITNILFGIIFALFWMVIGFYLGKKNEDFKHYLFHQYLMEQLGKEFGEANIKRFWNKIGSDLEKEIKK